MLISSSTIRRALFPALFCSVTLVAQDKPASIATVREFPVTMRQKVVAGKTPVGTKVEAKLAVATLMNGTVIPMNAVFSGEVVESVAKSASDPSRLAIRMDSVQWKKGTAPVKVFLTAWYYPIKTTPVQDLMFGPPEGPISKTWNGAGTYPDPSSPASQPFPGREPPKNPEITPGCTASCISDHRSPMKDVESTSSNDGIALTSSRLNIKLDKYTTYVLATGDLKAGR
jgi:hypothetical protein